MLENPDSLVIRPVSPADGDALQAFVRGLSVASRHHRFLGALEDLTPGLLRQLTQPPAVTQVGLVAVAGGAILGEVRYAAEQAGGAADFAIAVADPWRRRGIATRLFRSLQAYARGAGVVRLVGEVASGNRPMLGFAARMGFRAGMHPGDARLLRVVLDLPGYSANSRASSSYEAVRVAYSPVMVSSITSSAA